MGSDAAPEDRHDTPAADDRTGATGLRVACIDDDTIVRVGLSNWLLKAAPEPNATAAASTAAVDGSADSHATSRPRSVDVMLTYTRVEEFLQARPVADVVLVDLEIVRGSTPPVTASRHDPRPGGPGGPGGPRGPASSESSDAPVQGMEGVALVVAAGYACLIYTNEQRPYVLAACLAAGAHGIVQKAEPLKVLRDAVAAVADGGKVIPTSVAGLIEVYTRRGPTGPLSPREAEVLSARARGESFKSIASRLYLSPKTVEGYMAGVIDKFTDYLRTHSEADLERQLGLGPNDLLRGRRS